MTRMKEKLQAKLHTRGGFTLAETLLAILILLMVTIIVMNGIPSARNAYEKVVLASNAEALLSTTITTLRNELGTAQDIKTPSPKAGDSAKAGTILTYYSPNRGASSRLYVDSGGNQEIMFRRYYSEDGLSVEYEPTRLVSPETATGGLYVTYDSAAYSNGIVTFTNLSVRRANGVELTKRDTLSVRVVSYSSKD